MKLALMIALQIPSLNLAAQLYKAYVQPFLKSREGVRQQLESRNFFFGKDYFLYYHVIKFCVDNNEVND